MKNTNTKRNPLNLNNYQFVFLSGKLCLRLMHLFSPRYNKSKINTEHSINL